MIRRHLSIELLNFFSEALRNKGYGTASLQKMHPVDLLLMVAQIFGDMKQTEDNGENRSKSGVIEQIQSTIGTANGQPYCMELVQATTALTQTLGGYTSNLPAGNNCLDVFNRAMREGVEILAADSLLVRPGDISIWGCADTGKGHTGRVIEFSYSKDKPPFFKSLEGNVFVKPNVQGIGYVARTCGGMLGSNKKHLGFIREKFEKTK